MDKEYCLITAKDRAAIADLWVKRALEVYPPDTVRIFFSVKDRFRNPVGETIRRNLIALVETVLSEALLDEATEALDEIIRIRAVQELSARDAVRFVLELKQVLRDSSIPALQNTESLSALDARIDELALRAFDSYVGCREDVFRVKANQRKAYSEKLIERAEAIIHGHLHEHVSDPNSEDIGMKQRGELP